MTEKSERYEIHPIEKMIMSIRDQRGILDADLARIYGVPTRRLNEQVRRNADGLTILIIHSQGRGCALKPPGMV